MPKKKKSKDRYDLIEDAEQDQAFEPDDDQGEPVMYILVNSSLVKNMNKGKVSAQVAHAVCEVIWGCEDRPFEVYLDWKKHCQAKLVKRTSEKEMINIIANCRDRNNRLSATGDPFWCARIRDAGRTQIDPNSLTAIAFCPIIKKWTPTWIKAMPLL